MAQTAGALADRLPGRLKLLGGAFKLLGKSQIYPLKCIKVL